MKNKSLLILLLCIVTSGLFAQGIRDNNQTTAEENQLPLRRVVILTSGLSYYEHSDSVNGPVAYNLPFRLNTINDALKTLIINDPASANPSVAYQSERTLVETLRSLSIDLSDSPDMATILSRLRGVEAEITVKNATTAFTGRIVGIEYRQVSGSMFTETRQPWLTINTREGIRSFHLEDLMSIKFSDPAIERDLNRSLDIIAASRNSFTRQLLVNLPGTTRRNVSISYVIPSPVWKVSYRLDLGAQTPLFQGWAIIDNDSDTDWNNVELSLVAGRPASFIQELYPPYYVRRPVLPLAIAGTVEGVTHDRAVPTVAPSPAPVVRTQNDMMRAESLMMETEDNSWSGLGYSPEGPAYNLGGGTVQTASGSDAGGQFEFTIRNPVNLNRRMSAMFPLVESAIDARSTLIYNGSGRFPRIGAEITNTSGMKLPAGPITVYDGGVYAGDALIEFWNENEKRLISFGEDLSVTASRNDTSTRFVSTVRVSGGIMTITRDLTHIRTYTFINSSSASKQLIVEHTKTAQTNLVSPPSDDDTTSAYRFNVTLPANQSTVLTVNERRPIQETIVLLNQRPDILLSYSTNQEIPANVRQALTRAVELRRAVDTADASVRDIEAQRNRLISDQDRIRRNLEAAGNQTPQGQEYLRRLVSLDSEIDTMAANLQNANNTARAARTAYENYINTLSL
ncbi:MAG: DUF4139 domain-containing protein [Treponema sp.]|nr:DUF4139 domain-containing protein [Treponema sp.]